MNSGSNVTRWQVFLLITPSWVCGFPQRMPLTFWGEASKALDQLQQVLSSANMSDPDKYGRNYPRVMIDHQGFTLDPGLGARKLCDLSALSTILGSGAADLISCVSAAIPSTAPKKKQKARRKKQGSKGREP